MWGKECGLYMQKWIILVPDRKTKPYNVIIGFFYNYGESIYVHDDYNILPHKIKIPHLFSLNIDIRYRYNWLRWRLLRLENPE